MKTLYLKGYKWLLSPETTTKNWLFLLQTLLGTAFLKKHYKWKDVSAPTNIRFVNKTLIKDEKSTFNQKSLNTEN